MKYQLEEVIAEQYRIVDYLGEGLGGTTYKALDLKSNNCVVLKVLSFKQTKNWKELELFEREAKVLAQLKHPGIPNYVNYFQIDSIDEKCWYLVRKFISGQPLNTLVDDGWRTTEAEVVDIATQILGILVYLHDLKPPVIHRDIKPQNIIRQSDGKIYLVDFGAVTDIYRQTVGSSTVVGTYGYMSPEQFRGRAVPSTDLYDLGATLLYLLTHSSPAEFPQKKLKIDFRASINVAEQIGDWLEVMLEPIVEERFESASEALAVLRGEKKIGSWQSSFLRKPSYSKIAVFKTKNQINFTIPHNKGEPGDLNNRLIIFYITLLLAVLMSPSSATPSGLTFTNETVIRVVLAIPLCIAGFYFLFNYLFSTFGYTKLEINKNIFSLVYGLFGFEHKAQGKNNRYNRDKS